MKNQLTHKLISLNVETPHLIYMEDIIEKNIEHIKKSNRLDIDLSIYNAQRWVYRLEDH